MKVLQHYWKPSPEGVSGHSALNMVHTNDDQEFVSFWALLPDKNEGNACASYINRSFETDCHVIGLRKLMHSYFVAPIEPPSGIGIYLVLIDALKSSKTVEEIETALHQWSHKFPTLDTKTLENCQFDQIEAICKFLKDYLKKEISGACARVRAPGFPKGRAQAPLGSPSARVSTLWGTGRAGEIISVKNSFSDLLNESLNEGQPTDSVELNELDTMAMSKQLQTFEQNSDQLLWAAQVGSQTDRDLSDPRGNRLNYFAMLPGTSFVPGIKGYYPKKKIRHNCSSFILALLQAGGIDPHLKNYKEQPAKRLREMIQLRNLPPNEKNKDLKKINAIENLLPSFPMAYYCGTTPHELYEMSKYARAHQAQLFIHQNYRTHTNIAAEWLHWVSTLLFRPTGWLTQGIGYTIEPVPGAHKEWSVSLQSSIRIFSALMALLLLPIAAITLPFAFMLRLIDHCYRPEACFLVNGDLTERYTNPVTLTNKEPLHLRTHNVAFVPPVVSIITDIRSPVQRARELVQFILGDPKQPDVICFQEAALSNEDALEVLVNGISKVYRFIIHNVKHSRWGFTSGAMIASKYPIQYEGFYQFRHMVSPDDKAPRGILKVSLNTTAGIVMLYNIHTQSLLGTSRAQARLKQLKDVYQLVSDDYAKYGPHFHPIVLGDCNTSTVTHWGENNRDPIKQAETPVLDFLDENFEDKFLQNHDQITGQRISGSPPFLEDDKNRIDQSSKISNTADQIEEATGTLYHGPFYNKGFFMQRHLKKDQEMHRYDRPKKIVFFPKSKWGRPEYQESNAVTTARMDYILFPKISGRKQPLDAEVQIRNIINDERLPSASSDHLPVDALIFKK